MESAFERSIQPTGCPVRIARAEKGRTPSTKGTPLITYKHSRPEQLQLTYLTPIAHRLKRKKLPKPRNVNGRKKRRKTVTSLSSGNVSVVSVAEVVRRLLIGAETSINRVHVVRRPPSLAAAAVPRKLQPAADPHDEKHRYLGEEGEDGGIGLENVERQTRTFRHAEDMNDVILTTVKAGAPGLDVPGQGRARRRRVGEMTIVGALGVHRNTPDLQSRRVAAAESVRGPGLRTMDGNGGHTREIGKVVTDIDRPRPRLYRHRLALRDLHANRLRDRQLDLHPGKEIPTGGNVRYLWSVEWIGGDDHLLTRSRMLMKRKEDVMNEAGVAITVAIAGIRPRKGPKPKCENG